MLIKGLSDRHCRKSELGFYEPEEAFQPCIPGLFFPDLYECFIYCITRP